VDLIVLSVVAGFLIAVPAMGPSSAIIIRRVLVGREKEGLAFAGGSVLAEGLACLAAIWGVELALYTVPHLKMILEWGGMVLLVGIGGFFVFGRVPSESEPEELPEPDAASLGGQTLFGFTLTAFNPTLLATWTTVLGILLSMTNVQFAFWQKWVVPFGVMFGEVLWFAILVAVARRFGAHVDQKMIDWIIRGIGVLLIVLALWSALQKLLGNW
jgi:threonine/homoserine/homoserine lactone efflux protein